MSKEITHDHPLYKKFADALNIHNDMQPGVNPFIVKCIEIAEADNWISVESEGLPEQKNPDEAVEVIAWCEEEGEEPMSVFAVFAAGNFYLAYYWAEDGIKGDTITAAVKKYLPLPAPPNKQ